MIDPPFRVDTCAPRSFRVALSTRHGGRAIHPELEAEQAYVDHAYTCIEEARAMARRLTSSVEVGRGGTEQARFERESLYDVALSRLTQLDVGDASLVFGRIDHDFDHGGERFYIGRVGVWDGEQEPVVVDWRAPVAEAFYRATGREPMGLERRRHFATRGRTLLGIEDELFGDLTRLDADEDGNRPRIQGHGALIAALETARTGRLSDIVATIQGEQDEVIRAPMPGVLVVQGGPGTGKTVVALHRAAYLLYAHRFPLQGQGVLFIGPNRLFLGYIEQVLPALGEAGVETGVLGDLLDGVRVDKRDTEAVARIKGDLRIAAVIARAVKDRQRPIKRDLRIGFGAQTLWFTVDDSQRIVTEARRRFRTHNGARRYVENEVFTALAVSGRDEIDASDVREKLRDTVEIREALERMWPVLTPAHLLQDLFGSKALLRSANRGRFTDADIERLHRARREDIDDIVWTSSDVSLLDEAREQLGPRPGRKEQEALRTYGHIVVDEAQDLSPMELRMLNRHSLGGSMTIVGDIAQATGAWAHDSWDEILEHLPDRRPPRRVELTTGYRIPAPLMTLAARVLTQAAPDLKPPTSVRQDGSPPTIVGAVDLGATVTDVVRDELAAVGAGAVAVICPNALIDPIAKALTAAGLAFGHATRRGLDQQLTLVPVGLVKGLEVDAAVVVEPARIVRDEAQGMRALYVALTRATKRLALVHAEPLPDALLE
jgi:DNA helicase IV